MKHLIDALISVGSACLVAWLVVKIGSAIMEVHDADVRQDERDRLYNERHQNDDN